MSLVSVMLLLVLADQPVQDLRRRICLVVRSVIAIPGQCRRCPVAEGSWRTRAWDRSGPIRSASASRPSMVTGPHPSAITT